MYVCVSVRVRAHICVCACMRVCVRDIEMDCIFWNIRLAVLNVEMFRFFMPFSLPHFILLQHVLDASVSKDCALEITSPLLIRHGLIHQMFSTKYLCDEEKKTSYCMTFFVFMLIYGTPVLAGVSCKAKTVEII